MNRLQIIVSVAAIGLVILLFNLPKVKIDNNKVLAVSESETHDEAEHNDGGSMHAINISGEMRSKLNGWKTELENGNFSVTDSLVNAYSRIGLFDSAAFVAEKGVDNTNEVSLLRVADAYFKAFGFATNPDISSKYAIKARGFYEKALVLNPANKDAKSDMAMTYVQSENPMQGIMMLREIAESDPSHVKSQLNLGLLSVQSKQYDKALARFEKVLQLNPNHIEAAYYKGVTLVELGKIAEAKIVFDLLLNREDIDPAIKSSVEAYLKEIV
jgi:tetratricopeptide (TPR) repeat protein